MPNQEEQLVVAGDEASTILESAAFNSVINELVERTFQSFVNTEPGDQDKRENAYSHYRALFDVVDTLKQRAKCVTVLLNSLTTWSNKLVTR